MTSLETQQGGGSGLVSGCAESWKPELKTEQGQVVNMLKHQTQESGLRSGDRGEPLEGFEL